MMNDRASFENEAAWMFAKDSIQQRRNSKADVGETVC